MVPGVHGLRLLLVTPLVKARDSGEKSEPVLSHGMEERSVSGATRTKQRRRTDLRYGKLSVKTLCFVQVRNIKAEY